MSSFGGYTSHGSGYSSNRGNNKYIQYNDPGDVNSINLNNWYRPDDPRVQIGTGRILFAVEPRVPSNYACNNDKDIELSYILGVDRDNHPSHTSHFGYGRCPNGYCFGHIPGKYVLPTAVGCNNVQPPNMAPKRFYSGVYVDPYSVNSQAITDYNNYMGTWNEDPVR